MHAHKEKAAVFSLLLFVVLEFLLISHGSLSNLQRLASDQTALFWMLVELLQAALWGASTFLLVNGMADLLRQFRLKPTLSTVLRAFLIPLMLLFVLRKHNWNLGAYSFLTIRTASICGYLVAFVAVSGVLMAEMALAELAAKKDSAPLSVASYF